ncbi:MAG TPA: efflux RND transporter periplasmic adaptor subunit [Pyrinomonadaceae bacterium]|nr:efflux RND transporter periplasmic adaptor subunit [Acidobacteriota bacterium]HQZ95996.1 efflux RND transporter periplasmic adaptor subunit [Pyrinomonadaceae bacterium]
MKTKIALITATVTFAILTASCSKEKVPDAEMPAAAEVKNVTIVKVSRSSIEDFYEATGTVKAKTTTQVSANMMGRIISFPAAEGDTVSRGQVLVEIDNSESKAQLARAQAALKEAQASLVEVARSVDSANAGVRTAEANKQLAEKTFARYKELYERRSASAQEFDEAQSRLSASTSELERARANVQTILSKNKQINARIDQAKAEIANTQVYAGYSKIVSPVSGIVVKKFAEAGATAAPGTPLLSIEDNSQYRLEAAVEESRSRSIRVGGRVSVRIDALGEGEFISTIAEIMPTSDAASRSYTVKIDLPSNPALRTGLYGLARFPIAQKEAITLPQTAIVQRGQLTGVYVVGGDGKVQFRIVTTGKTSEGMTEILSGVNEGDEIANSEIEKLSDGTKVR